MADAEILVVEDDASNREALATLLKSEGYAVRQAHDGPSALVAFKARRPNLVLLDVMMPGMNGYAVCEKLRALDIEVPILFLTAKDGELDELRGLGVGADDYISKTASEPVLLARIAVAMRRSMPAAKVAPGDFKIGAWWVDAGNCNLVAEDGGTVSLTPREVELLRFLKAHPGESFSPDFCLARFWGSSYDGQDSTYYMAISRLRGKLGASACVLESAYGKGLKYIGD